jgi:hypothetical protein
MRKPHEPRLITAAPEWWKAFERAATAKGLTLSAWLVDSGRRRLPPEVRDALPAPTRRGRPRKDQAG